MIRKVESVLEMLGACVTLIGPEPFLVRAPGASLNNRWLWGFWLWLWGFCFWLRGLVLRLWFDPAFLQ